MTPRHVSASIFSSSRRWTSLVSSANAARLRAFSNATATESVTASPTQQLYMWGTDTAGCLIKPIERRDEKLLDVPTRVTDWSSLLNVQRSSSDDDAMTRIAKICCGPTDTAIVLSNGQCFVFGENKQGQLGLGHTHPVPQPQELVLSHTETDDGTQATGIVDVALGGTFSAYIDTHGALYTAGFGGSTFAGFGQLGHGDVESRPTATRVESLVHDGCRVASVATGESHLTVLTTEGEVLTAGAGSYGRLGNFDTVDQLYLEPVEILTADTGITAIAGGKSFTLALDRQGVVYGWGRNHKGQLGTGLGLAVDMYAMQVVPEPIETDQLARRTIVAIAAGHSHVAAVSDTGELLYWGMALHLEPVLVEELLHTKIVHVSCGHDYTLAVDEQGHVYSFGLGKTSVLGQGSVRRLNQPALLEALGTDATKRVELISAGWKHAACIVTE